MRQEDDLLQTTAVLVLDMQASVYAWPKSPYWDALKKPPVGIYSVGGLNPLTREGMLLYRRGGDALEAPVTLKAWQALGESLYTDDGEVVLSWPRYQKNPRAYFDTPDERISAYKLYWCVVTEYLSRLSPYVPALRAPYTPTEFIKDEYIGLYEEGSYWSVMDEDLLALDAFVGSDRHHLYFTRLSGYQLIIEKTIDYRIYDWYRLRHGVINDEGDDRT